MHVRHLIAPRDHVHRGPGRDQAWGPGHAHPQGGAEKLLCDRVGFHAVCTSSRAPEELKGHAQQINQLASERCPVPFRGRRELRCARVLPHFDLAPRSRAVIHYTQTARTLADHGILRLIGKCPI
jgi:hypothetical protein